jgi:hypothetical protein
MIETRGLVVLQPASGKAMLRSNAQTGGHCCPFFVIHKSSGDEQLFCPFSENPDSALVFHTCLRDKEHKRQHTELQEQFSSPGETYAFRKGLP